MYSARQPGANRKKKNPHLTFPMYTFHNFLSYIQTIFLFLPYENNKYIDLTLTNVFDVWCVWWWILVDFTLHNIIQKNLLLFDDHSLTWDMLSIKWTMLFFWNICFTFFSFFHFAQYIYDLWNMNFFMYLH